MKRIPVIFATNNKYAPFAGVSIKSLVDNSSPEYFYDITVFHTDLSEANLERFSSIKGENYSVSPLCVTKFIEKELKLMYTNFHFSKEMFYRILIPTVFADVDKAIYLDCDTVVLGDISELYETDLEGKVIAAATDIMHPRAKEYVIDDLEMKVSEYINSGVLVIDCVKFREQEIKRKFFEELSVRSKLKYPDQDLLNIVCHGNIKYLPRCWNYIWHYHIVKSDPMLNLAPGEMAQYLEDAKNIKLLHFTSNVKPWNNETIELSKCFWKYVEGSAFENAVIDGYKKIPMKHYIGYHFIDKEQDGFTLMASLYALDDIKIDDLLITVGGDEKKFDYYYSHVIEINGKVYRRTFFKFFISNNDIDAKTNIKFYDKRNSIQLKYIFATTFPLDASLSSYISYGDAVFYNEILGDVCVAKANEDLLAERKTAFADGLRARKGNPNYKKSNFLRLIHKILKPFFKKEVWFVSDRVDSAGDNGQAFFEYIRKERVPGVKAYFLIDKKSKDYKRIKRIGPVIQPGSIKAKIYYLFCTRNISAHFEKQVLHPIYNYGQLKDILFKCKNVFLQHGIIKDDLSLVYSRWLFDFDIFVTSAKGEYDSIAYNPAYGCGERVTKLTGLPRFDKLDDKKEKLIVFLPTWRKYCFENMSSMEPIKNASETAYVKFYTELLSNGRLLNTAKALGYKLCYYPHTLMRCFNGEIGSLDKEVFVSADKMTYADVFSRASLLFTDFSSCQFDFAYLRKPVMYCHFDKEEFFGTHTYRPGYFDYVRDGFGEVVYNAFDAVDLLVEYMERGCELRAPYSERIEKFFAFNDKNNCHRVLEEILKIQ